MSLSDRRLRFVAGTGYVRTEDIKSICAELLLVREGTATPWRAPAEILLDKAVEGWSKAEKERDTAIARAEESEANGEVSDELISDLRARAEKADAERDEALDAIHEVADRLGLDVSTIEAGVRAHVEEHDALRTKLQRLRAVALVMRYFDLECLRPMSNGDDCDGCVGCIARIRLKGLHVGDLDEGSGDA